MCISEPPSHLWYLLVVLAVEVEHGPDLLWRGREHIQVVERPLISEAAEISITNYFFVPFLSTEFDFTYLHFHRFLSISPVEQLVKDLLLLAIFPLPNGDKDILQNFTVVKFISALSFLGVVIAAPLLGITYC